MKLLFINVFMITIATETNLVHSQCINQGTVSDDFEVQCYKSDHYNVRIICHSDDWTKFPRVDLNNPLAINIMFKNCSFPMEIGVRDFFYSTRIGITRKITFDKLPTIPSRQNFHGLSVFCLDFLNSDFTELPSDLLYDLQNLNTLHISLTKLEHIPKDFFGSLGCEWAENLAIIYMKNNKLKKITRNNFHWLVKTHTIDLSYNNIEEIQSGAFDRLFFLDTLILSSNRLHTLPSFERMTNLRLIDLSKNLIDDLPHDLLTKSSNLREFSMNANNGTLSTLPQGFFKNLSNLHSIHLQGSRLKNIPSNLFAGCFALLLVDFSDNHLVSLPSGIFDDNKNLEAIDMRTNRLVSLPAHIFKGLIHLTTLSIYDNQLTSLMSDVLEDLQSIFYLDASENNLTHIDDQFIMYLKSAKTIILQKNQLTFNGGNKNLSKYQKEFSSMKISNKIFTNGSENQSIEQFYFDPDIKLKDIDLSNNRITEFNAELINIMRYSKSVDLSNNQISKINLDDFSLGIVMRNTTYFDRYVKVKLNDNPLDCDCHLANFVHYVNGWRENKLYNIFADSSRELKCASPPEFENYNLHDIRFEKLNCLVKTTTVDDACNGICMCREYSGIRVLSVDCSYRNLTQLPLLITNVHNWSIELNMTGNMLQRSPSLKGSYLTNVTSLDLSNNYITEVTIDLFSPKLQQLKLHGNKISRLDSDVIKHLARSNNTLHSITLYNNKWICDCEARELITFVQKKLTNYNFHGMMCYKTNHKLYKMTASELCKNMIVIMAIASSSIVFFAIVVAGSVVFYYKNQREIKVWLYSKRWCLWFVAEDELDKDKEYDAFVSFSHKDEDFVEKEIVTKLEEGPRPYKLCLHYRDWLAGEWIPVQISRSVAASRRTIVILTPNFLESVWGLLEFRAAHTQALKEGRNRVIVILYGEIGNIDDLDQEMKDYLRQNTYIKWGDPWFWDKLKYALPHAKKFSKKEMQNESKKNHSVEFLLPDRNDNNATSKSDAIPMPKNTNDFVHLLNATAEDKHLIVSGL